MTPQPGVLARLREAARLLSGLRRHDLRAAASYARAQWGSSPAWQRPCRLAAWAARQMLGAIPEAMAEVSFARPVSRTPIWLAAGNPLADVPWRDGAAGLPAQVDAVVIGAGFTGAACAYHWAQAGSGATLAVLEMGDPASGASGRNEGLVVMGRYFAMVRDTVRPYLDRVRPDLGAADRGRLAEQFAAAYARSAYRNADLIERTVRDEGFDCDYERQGWIQARDAGDQASLRASVEAGAAHGFHDWTTLPPAEVLRLGGMRVAAPAGFSRRAASFHPARWVWCLLARALRDAGVSLFTRTQVLAVADDADGYAVRTDRGTVRARCVVNATESYTARLHPRYRQLIHPVQTQAAFGRGGPAGMAPHIGLSGKFAFFGRHRFGGLGEGVMVGSDATRVSARHAGRNAPSRFITKFCLAELHRHFGPAPVAITHEWSGTPGFTADEFPVVGLLDGRRQWIIGGMCGSGTGVSFNAARHVVQRILGRDGPNDYPEAYFAPSRLLDPARHPWPAVEPRAG